MTTPIEQLVEVAVPVGGRAMVVSDLLLSGTATAASSAAAAEVARAVASWDGPGVLVVAGNLFDLLTCAKPGVAASLEAHPGLVSALAAFSARPARRVVILPGSRDRALAWDGDARRILADRLGAGVALAAELRIATAEGDRLIRVEPGARFDPRFAVEDPLNPAESPLGQHVLTEILPSLSTGPWTRGVNRLTDLNAAPRFFASRLAYRRLIRYSWWLVVPFVIGLAVKFPLVWARARHPSEVLGTQSWETTLALIAVTTLVDLVVVGMVAAFVTRRAWAAVSGSALGRTDTSANGMARSEARSLVTAGHAGLVAGHTLAPELTALGNGFFASTGAAAEVVTEHPAWLGLPPVFLHQRLVSWVEMEAGAELHVRLLVGRSDLPGGAVVERVLARPHPHDNGRPAVVASFPHGRSWPEETDPGIRSRRVRRVAAAAIALGGIASVVSAITPPLRSRLRDLHDWFPLVVSQTADALVGLAGLALIFLARGIRRGQRQAWSVALAVLIGSSVLHIVKGGDVEESIVSLAIAAYLLLNRREFGAAVDRPSVWRALLTLAAGAVGVLAVSTVTVEATLAAGRHWRPLGPTRAVEAVGGRMVGVHLVPLPHRLDLFLSPALVAVTLGLVVAGLWLASRPVVTRFSPNTGTLERARQVVARHGRGTLDYFALRDDKHFFFHRDTVVAFAVYSGVCLVSPDPVGPEAERDAAWDAFRRYADAQGWTLAVLGAGEAWLPVYRASGMHDMYVGDEAVLDVTRMSLEGGRHKSLRQAVNRVAKYGYTVSFHDPARIEPDLRSGLQRILAASRRGDVERGFSMTLGRIFDLRDGGLLLAVASDADARPVAFCQYVPAPGIDGYSLDLMRRDDGDHPNGLIDFLVVETARYLRDRGMRGLGLNFATMRAVLAGESGDGVTQRVERWLLKRMSGSMQIESLWKFNAKFDPSWQARYFVYDSPEHLVPAAMAMARAESFWELPVIGRFLVPRGNEDARVG